MTLCLSVISVTGVAVIESGAYAAYQAELALSAREAANLKTIVTNTFLAEKYLDRHRAAVDGRPAARSDEQIISQTARAFFPDLRSDIVTLAFLTADGRVITANDGIRLGLGKEELTAVVRDRRPSTTVRSVGGVRYLLMFEIVDLLEEQYILFIARDIGFLDARRREQYVSFALVVAAALAVLAAVTALLSRRFTRPIEDLTAAAVMIAAGDHARRARVTTRDELAALAGQFNRMADEIENRIALLNDQAAEKQRFIDNLTHELKNPLTAIIGYANLLLTATYDEEVFRTSAEYIRTEGRRILELADRLFDLILYKNRELERAEVEAGAFLAEIAGHMKFRLEPKSLRLVVEAEPGALRLDRELMKSALTNLVDNAIKASDAGSVIRLRYGRHDGAACLSVEDSGKGIPAADIDKITEPFYRVHRTRAPEEKGVGLGLALTAEIVRLHGARLVISSALGKGTRVCVHFAGC
jgi:signal transduction histidine kinase